MTCFKGGIVWIESLGEFCCNVVGIDWSFAEDVVDKIVCGSGVDGTWSAGDDEFGNVLEDKWQSADCSNHSGHEGGEFAIALCVKMAFLDNAIRLEDVVNLAGEVVGVGEEQGEQVERSLALVYPNE